MIQRLERDILPTLRHYPHWEFELICIDNDPAPNQGLVEFLRQCGIPVRYLWNGGANLQVAAAKNQLYGLASHPLLIYACANHGRLYNPTWLEDMVLPFQDPQVALAGTVMTYPLDHIGKGEGTGIFVQGGLLAARVEILRRHRMTDEFPHMHSDKWICYELLRHGYRIAHVPSVLSLWRLPIPAQHAFKYVHAEE
jgi:hypothetical protein